MFSPTLSALVVAALWVALRIATLRARPVSARDRDLGGFDRLLAALGVGPASSPQRSLIETIVALGIGVFVVAILERAGLFEQAIREPATPVLVIAIVVLLQIAFGLAVITLLRAQSRTRNS